jgi:hypothetical protein
VVKDYATSQKDAGLRADEVNEFFSIYLILPTTLHPGVHPASNRYEYQKQKNNVSEGVKCRRCVGLATIRELIVYIMCDP